MILLSIACDSVNLLWVCEKMTPYIKINNLNMKSISGSSISFMANKGDIIGITGANGCGKSCLASYLAGLTKPDAMGKVIVGGFDPYSQLDESKLHKICGIVYQNPKEGIVFENFGRDLIFGPENIGLPVKNITKRAKFYMKKYDLERKQARLYSTLSAGQQQRAALCSVLAMHPDILILDEAFSMQSSADTSKYMDMIIKAARKKGQTVIIFSKKRSVLEKTEYVYELAAGKLREIDLEGMEFTKFEQDMDVNISGSSGPSLKIDTIERSKGNRETGISLHNVSLVYDNKSLFRGLNLRFKTGSYYRISGTSGSGKSTMLQLVGGLIKPTEGEVFISETTKTGYIFQYPEDGFVENTVLDDVMFGPLSEGIPKSKAREMATSVLEFVGVSKGLWDRSPLNLSMGEQRLVAIAGALALNPDFILIDEPFAGLDQRSRKHIAAMISALAQEGKCIITVES